MAGECQPGIIIPIWPPSNVSELHAGQRALRGLIYAVAIVYCFWGISVAADKYMDAIDYICQRSEHSLFKLKACYRPILLVIL